MSDALSTEELLSIHLSPIKVLNLVRQKILVPVHTEDELNQTSNRLNHLKDYLKQVRVDRRHHRTKAHWIPNKNCAKVVKIVGPTNFGTVINGELFISPDECVFLLEVNKLELLWDAIPFSVEQAYAVLLDTKEKLEKYRAFKALSVYGYRLKETKICNSTNDSDSDNSNTTEDEIPSKKVKTKKVDEFLEKLKEQGASNFVMNDNVDFEQPIYRGESSTENFAVIIQPENSRFSMDGVSQNDSTLLNSFQGNETVSFYQFHKVDLENSTAFLQSLDDFIQY